MFNSIVLSLGNIIPVPPINHVYIRSNGNVEPSTPLITADNNIYTLTGDFINTTIEIEKDSITLDGAGYSINGQGYQTGVNISNRTNITIKNLVINQFSVAIRMDHASKNTITGNKMSTFTAVHMEKSNDNKITDNVSTRGYGIYGDGSNNIVMNNSFSGVLSGGGNGMGIFLSGNNNKITRNTIIHQIAINMGNSQYNTISNNTILNGRVGILPSCILKQSSLWKYPNGKNRQ